MGPEQRSLDGSVHVWTVRMYASRQSAPLNILRRDERDRAARYRLENERRNFVLRRTALRLLLSSYAGLSPSDVLLSAVPGEKPIFVNSPAPAIQYSASSSDELAIFAISRAGSVGIDIESICPIADLHKVAQDVFAGEELAVILSERTEVERLRAFYSAWTRKEAVLKCDGKGVLVDLRLVSAPAFGEGLHDLNVAQGYAAALACAEPATEVLVHEGPLTVDELVEMLPEIHKSVAV